MRGDFSRIRRDPTKHDDVWLEQQGRLVLDSDANEERLARIRLLEEQDVDIIGAAGAPQPGTGFRVIPMDNTPDDFLINGGDGPAGHLYVGGMLCRNDAPVTYKNQPDFPSAPALPVPQASELTGSTARYALAYVEAHRRYVGYLQDNDIREVALEGVDTTAHLRTTAQVKVQPIDDLYVPDQLDCDSAAAHLPGPGNGSLLTIAPSSTASADPCALPDSTIYTGRENRLYRVEVHHPGDVLGTIPPAFSLGANAFPGQAQLPLAIKDIALSQEAALVGRRWDITDADGSHREALRISGVVRVSDAQGMHDELVLGAALQYFHASGSPLREPRRGISLAVPAQGLRPGDPTITVSTGDRGDARLEDGTRRWFIRDGSNAEGIAFDDPPDPSGTITLRTALQFSYGASAELVPWATFKWSRSNGAVAAQVIDGPNATADATSTRLQVDSLGRDELTTLRNGDLVELVGDVSELGAGAGVLCTVVGDPDPDQLAVVVNIPVQAALLSEPHLVMRRWDGFGVTQATFSPAGTPELDLGDGVQVQFGGSDLRAGDYWWIETRATDGSINQIGPVLEDGRVLPAGIERRRTSLAILKWFLQGSNVALEATSCVRIFNPLTAFPEPDQVISVKGAFIGATSSNTLSTLLNDTEVDPAALAEGIQVQCTLPLQPKSVQPATVYVTLDLPYPLNEADRKVWGQTAVLGFQSITVNATVSVAQADPTTMVWTPAAAAKNWLKNLFAPLGSLGSVTAHLCAKGNVIWADQGNDRLYLDGDALGALRASPAGVDVRLPSGNGRAGGDFEMWFRLVPHLTIALHDITVTPGTILGPNTVQGRVSLTGNATAATVVKVTSGDPNVTIPNGGNVNNGNVTIPAGQSFANFTMQVAAVPTTRTVTVTATLNTVQKATQLVLQAPPFLNVSGVRFLDADVGNNQQVTVNEAWPVPSPGQIFKIFLNTGDTEETGPNVIEVTFGGGALNAATVTDKTFIVKHLAQVVPSQAIFTDPAHPGVVYWLGPVASGSMTLKGDPDPLGNVITAANGTRLDGEPAAFPSGDGAAGGDFQLAFTITRGKVRALTIEGGGKGNLTTIEKNPKAVGAFARNEIVGRTVVPVKVDPYGPVKYDIDGRTISSDIGLVTPVTPELSIGGIGRAFVRSIERPTTAGDATLRLSDRSGGIIRDRSGEINR